jgi:hypothetical protein
MWKVIIGASIWLGQIWGTSYIAYQIYDTSWLVAPIIFTNVFLGITGLLFVLAGLDAYKELNI